MTVTLFLLLLPISILIGVPGYISYREGMLKKTRQDISYTRKRVVKLTAVNLALNILTAVYFFILFSLLLIQTPPSSSTVLLAALFILSIMVTFYGNGIYLTSIVLEAYTLPDLKLIPYYKTQFIATHLFHGPISHVMIYSGWLFALLFLAIWDLTSGLQMGNWFLVIAIGGVITGITYAFGQIYNGTAPYQLITGILAWVTLVGAIAIWGISYYSHPIAVFFLTTSTSFNFSLVTYLILQKLKDGQVNWDKSGY